MIPNETLFEAMKGQLWQEAIGKLRALIEVMGSVPSNYDDSERPLPWEQMQQKVEAFVKDAEDLVSQ